MAIITQGVVPRESFRPIPERYTFNQKAFDSTVQYYMEEFARQKIEQSVILLAAVAGKTRPKHMKLGDLKGKIAQLVSIRTLATIQWDARYKRSIYRVYGVSSSASDEQWMENKQVLDIQRRFSAFFPKGIPPQVQDYLVADSERAIEIKTPRVTAWLAGLYDKLSRQAGDYAAVEAERLRNDVQLKGGVNEV